MSRIWKSLAFAGFLGMSVVTVQACSLHEQGTEQVNPDGSPLRRHVPQKMAPKAISSSSAMDEPTASSSVESSDIEKKRESENTVRSTVQNTISSTPTFHYQDAKGNEITEYRELGLPSEIEVRSSMGTHYQLSEPTDPTPMPNRAVRGVPSVTLTY
jgi:hypothetical protein